MARTFSFSGIKSGQISQIAFVVPDVEEAMRFYVETLGIGPFTVKRGFKAPDGWYRGKFEMPELTIAQTYNGRMFVEIIQQHDDVPSIYTEFINKHGYGLHHFAFAIAPEDYDATLEKYYSKGFENIFTDTLHGNTRIRYLGPDNEESLEKLRDDIGVSYIECVEVTDIQQERMNEIYESFLNWDGTSMFRKGWE